MPSIDEKITRALTAEGDELWALVRDSHDAVISNVILNRNLTEEMAVSLAKKRGLSPETLGFLAGDVRFRDSDTLKLAICRNPASPQRVVLAMLKFLRIFDLADIAKNPQVNINVRRKIEQMVCERVAAMPSGTKTALARRAGSAILLALMETGDERVLHACLESPLLTEGQLYTVIHSQRTKDALIRMIAGHQKWSARYQVKRALTRNFYTPMTFVLQFIRDLTTRDLKDLYHDPALPLSTRPFIYKELGERGETVETLTSEVYGLPEDGEWIDREDDFSQETS